MTWILSGARWFARLVGSRITRTVIQGIERTGPYLSQIYEWVHLVAQITPTRADDEILRAADALGIPLLLEPQADRGAVLAEIVLRAAQRKWPDAPLRVLRRAIEIAYGGVKP